MPVFIEGKKFYLKELQGTDVKICYDFMRKNKLLACVMVYVDSENNVHHQALQRGKKGREQMDKIIKQIEGK